MGNILHIVGCRIREIRKMRGLTQEQLAVKCQLQSSYLGSVERGERNISLETLEKIIEALEVTPTELFNIIDIQTEDHIEKKDIIALLSLLLLGRETHEIKLLYKVIHDIISTIDYNKTT